MLCENCGSADVSRTQSSRVDRVVRFLTGKKRFTCMRCGWSARRDWQYPGRKKSAAKAGPMLVHRSAQKHEPKDDADLVLFD